MKVYFDLFPRQIMLKMAYLSRNSQENCFIMCYFMYVLNYVIFHELWDWMRSEVDCVKSHHHLIPEGLANGTVHSITYKYLRRKWLGDPKQCEP